MSTCGRRLLSSLIYKGDLAEFLNLGLGSSLFKDKEAALFEFIDDHARNHGQLPHPETIEGKLGDVLTDSPEPAAYYMKEVETRYLQGRMKELVLGAQEFLKDEDPSGAHNLIEIVMGDLYEAKNRNKIFDFRDAIDIVMPEYKKQHSPMGGSGVKFGWPTLDDQSSGMLPGDYWTFVGRPSAGKTFFLLRAARHGWKHQKQRPMFFSLEMNSLIIHQRLAAMDTGHSLTRLMKGMLSTKALQAVMSKLNANKTADMPFWIVDASMAHDIDDAKALVKQYKPTSCWIDAAYLLRSKNARMNKFERIADNAEQMKQNIASDLGIPCAASYQFLRTTKNDKKAKGSGGAQKQTMDDVFGGDAMAQLSTGMLGLFEPDSIETKKKRHVEILKGRNGETGGFDVHWDFMGMDFAEIVEPQKQDLQFID